MTGTSLQFIPYRGTAPAVTDLLGGQVDLMFLPIHVAMAHVKSGRLVALAIGSERRHALMPDVPTVSEAGVPGYEATIWLGVMSPVNVPRLVLERLNGEITKVTSRPDIRKTWNEQGAEPMVMNLAEFEKYLHADIAKWARVVKVSGARADQ